ncbi:imidazole glycerol phosphate synthase subunit HisH [Chryseobacterium sp.]|uniref:imidazole glycerol phosphate synthase subunit HisH n=1 Tax=Chryseobacterium sp. TaxID=1871047 RepID=UPI00388ED526
MITIIDYGVGNIKAFVNIYNEFGIPCTIAKNDKDLNNATKLILPGVGNFDYALGKFKKSGLVPAVEHLVLHQKFPILGVCVGMQIMGTCSEEGNSKGLGWVEGKVKRIETNNIDHQTKLPHMGWNDVHFSKSSKLFEGLSNCESLYFLHSYYFQCLDKTNEIAYCEYGHKVTSAIQKDNIYGIQCHPEKSHLIGSKILINFAKLCLNLVLFQVC